MDRPQLYWEDIEVGMAVPPLEKYVTRMQLVKYAGAEEDWHPFHVDEEYARKFGLPHVVHHGLLDCGLLCQLMTDWIGLRGKLKKLRSEYRRPNFPNEMHTCKGRVTRKYVQDGDHLVDCEIWIEKGDGTVSTPGTATVGLPSREVPRA